MGVAKSLTRLDSDTSHYFILDPPPPKRTFFYIVKVIFCFVVYQVLYVRVASSPGHSQLFNVARRKSKTAWYSESHTQLVAN